MTWSLSDTEAFRFLGRVPRLVWIILLIIAIITRVWILIAISFSLFFVFIILAILGFIAFEEIIDDDGPGHKGPHNEWWHWFIR